MMPVDAPKFIYIVEAENGRVKIGRSRSPEQRIVCIRTHSPLMVRLIAVWEDTAGAEAALHDKFAPARLHCEWFMPTREVLAFVRERRGVGVDEIMSWDEVRLIRHSSDARARRMLNARRSA